MRRLYLAAVVILLLESAVHASSFVRPSEDDMIQNSAIVARVKVGEIVSYKKDLGDGAYSIGTVIKMMTVQCFKGCVADTLLEVYEPGGVVGNTAAVVTDSPEYMQGDDRLVFLSKDSKGFLRTKNMALGSVGLFSDEAGQLRFVNPGVLRVDMFKSFQERLREKVGLGAAARVVQFKTPQLAGKAQVNAAYRWLGEPGSKWRVPVVQVVLPTTGDEILGLEESRKAILAAFSAWEDVPTSSIDFEVSGVEAPQGFVCKPGKLLISFGDPKNEIDDPSGCSGVLAIGGFCSSGVPAGDGFQTITGAAYVSNNGWAGCGFWSASDHKNFDEVSTHELGHAIGLGHSAESGQPATADIQDATMYWMAHFDGRGAGLRAYDRGAVSTLYPGAVAPTPSLTPSPQPTLTPSPTPTRVRGFFDGCSCLLLATEPTALNLSRCECSS